MIPELKRHRPEDHPAEISLMYKRKCRPARSIQHNSVRPKKKKRNQKTRLDKTQGFSTQISYSKECFQVIQEKKSIFGTLKNTGAVGLCAKFKGHRGKYIAFLHFVDPVSLTLGAHWRQDGDESLGAGRVAVAFLGHSDFTPQCHHPGSVAAAHPWILALCFNLSLSHPLVGF